MQVVLQHTPSMQLPLRQSPLAAQLELLTALHAPAPLHTSAPELPVHSFAGSVPDAMLEQTPSDPEMLHA